MNEREQKVQQAQAALDAVDVADIQLALDETYREKQVRERCFPRWVQEGRVSKTDASDRLARQILAVKILQLLLDSRGVPAGQ
jgi:hypothetical protein